MMLANVLWLLPLVWGAGSAAYGGPPLAFEQRPTVSEALRFPLPGKQFLRMPSTRLEAVASPRWQLVDQIRPLSVQDLEKLSDQQRPPLEFTLPLEFREYKPPANRLEGTVETVGVPVVEGVVTNPPRRGLVGWLPQRVQSWIPTLPSLSSLFPRIPDYLPGFDFEAEVHRKPTKLPHIPTPSELLKEVSNLVDSAIHRLHRKQEQLFELVKCSCPRPARCDAIFQEFLTIGGSVSGSVSGAASLGAAAPSKVEDAGSPSVSLYTGLVSPGGSEGPGVGFYVDRSGPHLGHYHHGPHPSVASAPVVVPQPATVLVSKAGSAADHVASLASPAGLSLPGKLSSPSELKAP